MLQEGQCRQLCWGADVKQTYPTRGSPFSAVGLCVAPPQTSGILIKARFSVDRDYWCESLRVAAEHAILRCFLGQK